jgi:Capsular polysaccharide biosynthesis protein
MSFLSSKKSFISSGLLDNMTDIHSHILFGVDDGVRNYEETVASLQWLKSLGINRLYLTPHIMCDFINNTSVHLSESFRLLIKRLEEDGIDDIPELRLSAEYMLEPTIVKHRCNGFLVYDDHHILVETSYINPPIGLAKLLEELMEEGYSPILAHPERYYYMDKDDYDFLIGQGIKFQLNFLSLTGAYGSMAKDNALFLLNENYYNYAGSDFHNLERHRDHFSTKCLTKKNINSLKYIIDNNNNLWPSSY